MMPRSVFARRLWSGSAVVLASVASVLIIRGRHKAYASDAPAYRQKGPAAARVTIVEFSDFQCPACGYAVEPVQRLLGLYGQDVRFVFKHFPLKQHAKARAAAAAADCAGRQGKFWEFHDRLYASQADWVPAQGKDPLADYARDLGLDSAAFSACRADPATAAAVEKDLQEGNDRWVLSTPTFFINDKRFSGSRQLTDRGVLWIDRILKKK
ncbi:MAG: DsbA family protein [Elusimicrobiota bacterium]|jgi:protein-disulfide isomerase